MSVNSSSLPDFAFKTTGSGSKTSILLLRKFSKKERDSWARRKQRYLVRTVAEFERRKATFSKTLKKFLGRNDIEERLLDNAEKLKGCGLDPILQKTKNGTLRMRQDLSSRELVEFLKATALMLWPEFKAAVRAVEMALEDLENYEPDFEAHAYALSDADYPVFMAKADHIGYDATGRMDSNELFAATDEGHIFQEARDTILGQWREFESLAQEPIEWTRS